jgi:secondary thiamine-phosphate synthase enzyme
VVSLTVPWHQIDLVLRPRSRGIHLVTEEITAGLPQLRELRVGMLSLFLQHTSAALAINENADPEVRADLARWLDRAVPDGAPYFEHTAEGDDDMPAHVKAALLGPALTIPVRSGRLLLGTWQGIYLAEYRHAGGARRLVATLWGE